MSALLRSQTKHSLLHSQGLSTLFPKLDIHDLQSQKNSTCPAQLIAQHSSSRPPSQLLSTSHTTRRLTVKTFYPPPSPFLFFFKTLPLALQLIITLLLALQLFSHHSAPSAHFKQLSPPPSSLQPHLHCADSHSSGQQCRPSSSTGHGVKKLHWTAHGARRSKRRSPPAGSGLSIAYHRCAFVRNVM